MATTAPGPRFAIARGTRFFLISAVLMALVLAVGFGLQFALGRSSFAVPAYVHAHALIFVSWTALYVAQAFTATTGNRALHRQLGWLALIWLPAMVVMGSFITVMAVRHERVPFFFTPAEFLLMNPLSVLVFAALSGWAIARRRQTQWHRRLMMCGMAVLTGPGWGRFAPIPLLIPHAVLGVTALILLFPVAGVIRDLRVDRRVHPAWWCGIAAILAMQLVDSTVPATPIGTGLYALATRGIDRPAAPLDYPPFPPGFPIPHP